MPRFDGTGPVGNGPKTGRGLGNCADTSSQVSDFRQGFGFGRGLWGGFRRGFGRRFGNGFGMGLGRGFGRGFGFNGRNSGRNSSKDALKSLEQERDITKEYLETLNNEIDSLK